MIMGAMRIIRASFGGVPGDRSPSIKISAMPYLQGLRSPYVGYDMRMR